MAWSRLSVWLDSVDRAQHACAGPRGVRGVWGARCCTRLGHGAARGPHQRLRRPLGEERAGELERRAGRVGAAVDELEVEVLVAACEVV